MASWIEYAVSVINLNLTDVVPLKENIRKSVYFIKYICVHFSITPPFGGMIDLIN